MASLIYMWNLKLKSQKKKKKVKLTETEDRKVVARGWQVGEIGRG